MITKTDIKVDLTSLIEDYEKNISKWPVYENRVCLNNLHNVDDYEKNSSLQLVYAEFPYMNSIFKNTIWEETLKRLPGKIGRARLMIMNPQGSLFRHRDLQARWQLALITDPNCTIYDFEEGTSYHIPADSYFYRLDARKPHAAFNKTDQLVRVSLVVEEYV